jgi:hypothetical protein
LRATKAAAREKPAKAKRAIGKKLVKAPIA